MGMAMLVVMLVVVVGALSWHGHDGDGHMRESPSAQSRDKTAQELLDEAYARGEITREEYLRKREDMKPR